MYLRIVANREFEHNTLNYMNINAYINKVCVYVYVYVNVGGYCCISY